MRLLFIIGFVIFIFGKASSQTTSKNWPGYTPFQQGTLGYTLNNTFRVHSESCKITNISKKFKDIPENEKNYVPDNLISAMDIKSFSLYEKNHEFISSTSSRLMFNVFKEEEKNISGLDSKISEGRRLSVSNPDIPDFLISTQSGRPGFLLRANCGAYIEAAANADINIPIANFQQAIQAEESRESSIVLVYGWVTSPLFDYLANLNTSLQAHQDVWNFYIEKEEFVNNAHFIAEFLGLQMRHLTDEKDNLEFDSKVSGGGGIGIYKVNATLSGGINKSNIYTQQNWETYLIPSDDNENLRWKSLPLVNDLKQFIEDGVRKRAEIDNYGNYVTRGGFTHYALIEGLDKKICGSEGNWNINLVSKGIYENDIARITEVYYDDNNSTCKCKIEGIVTEDEFTNLSERLRIDYSLINNKSIVDSDDNITRLEFDFSEEFGKSDHPIAKTPQVTYRFSTNPQMLDPTKDDIIWEIPVAFDDDNRPVDYSLTSTARISDGNPVITGLAPGERITILSFKPRKDDLIGDVYVLKLKFNESFSKVSYGDEKIINTSLNFNVPLNNSGEFANVTIRFDLIVPVKKPDIDNDGIFDDVDNCLNTRNPKQLDADFDGIGDACDNCRVASNADQADIDSDGKGDACDAINNNNMENEVKKD
jgi:hypothetical protein